MKKFATWLIVAALSACGEGGNSGPVTPKKSVYALMYEVYSAVGSTSYLSLLDSLDVAEIDPKKAREFGGGRAYLQYFNGWLFVGEPSTPIVRRYSLSESGELTEDASISFANFGLKAGTIDPWGNTFISPTKAYLFDFKEGVHVIWNPTTMAIIGEIKPPAEFVRSGLTTDGSPAVARGNRLYRSVFWVDYNTATYATDHLLAVYDLEQDKLLELVPETRCPGPGNLAHTDESGNIYFSNWIWPVAGTLMRGAPKSCVLRIKPGADRYDADWSLSYADIAGGKEGGVFTYQGNNQALVSIFDHTRLSFDSMTDPWKYAGSSNWSIWKVDLGSKAAAPVEGIPLNAGAYLPARFDGRSYVMVPGEGASSTQLYELKDGRGVAGLKVPGWSYALVKAR